MLAVCLAAAVAWLATGDLPSAARIWTVVLLVPLPSLAVWQARTLPHPEQLPRSQIYLSTIISLWVLALITAAFAAFAGFSRIRLGLFLPPDDRFLPWSLAPVAGGLAIVYAARALGVRESPILAHLIPRSRNERRLFGALSLTAGITEEFIFRGFLLTALLQATGSLALATLLSAAAFGVVHAYQDPAGAARAAALGTLLAAPVLATGSILPAMIAHALLDLVLGLVLADQLMRT